MLDGFEYRGISFSLPAPTPSLFLIPSSPTERLEQAGAARTNTKRLPFASLMSRIDLARKNLLANCFRNFGEKYLSKTIYYQKSIEEIANFAKILKVTRIFVAM